MPSTINWKNLIKELLKSIRGDFSQQDINNKLGVTFNQAYRWESGTTKISWHEFLSFCEICRCDLKAVFSKVEKSLVLEPQNIGGFLSIAMGRMSQAEFADKIGVPRKTLGKWLKGESSPPLENILQIFESEKGILVPFLVSLAPLDHLHSIEKLYAQYMDREFITLKYPVVSLILNYLHTDVYKSLDRVSSDHFCQLFGLSAEEVAEIFQYLESSGTVVKQNELWRMGKYDVFRVVGNPDEVLKRYLFYIGILQEVLKKKGMDSPDTHFHHMIYSTNQESMDRIKEVIKLAHREISQILSEPQASINCQKVSVLISGLVSIN